MTQSPSTMAGTAAFPELARPQPEEMLLKRNQQHQVLVDALTDTLRMLRAAHMQIGMSHDSNNRVIKAHAVPASVQS